MASTRQEIKELLFEVESCQEWTGGKFTAGYGSVRINGKAKKAHRVSWEDHVGPIPEGMCVCHTCDNPSCINPNHLFLGTHQDNMRDKVNKGRQWKGGHGLKLTNDQIEQMVSEYTGAYGELSALGIKYGINRNTVKIYLDRAGKEVKIIRKWPKNSTVYLSPTTV